MTWPGDFAEDLIKARSLRSESGPKDKSLRLQRLLSDALLDESHFSARNGPLTRKGADIIADKLLLEILKIIREQ